MAVCPYCYLNISWKQLIFLGPRNHKALLKCKGCKSILKAKRVFFLWDLPCVILLFGPAILIICLCQDCNAIVRLILAGVSFILSYMTKFLLLFGEFVLVEIGDEDKKYKIDSTPIK
jgi:hypothetical protein